MPSSLFVNLPVQDVARSRAFFSALGFGFNPQYSNDKAICLVVNPQISVMLLSKPFFQGFTPKPVADAHHSAHVLLAPQRDIRAEVDELVARALAAGGSSITQPEDLGFMYSHDFTDPDGHGWGPFVMTAPAPEAPAGS